MQKASTMLSSPRIKSAGLAFVSAALAAAVAVAGFRLAAPLFDHGRAICAELSDAVGLYTGNKVKLLGLEVGEVTAIANTAEHVRVDFTVPDDLDLPADEGVVTMSDSIVTDRHLELTKPYADGPKLSGPGCIGIGATKTPVGISDSLTAVKDLADTILGQKDGQDTADPSGAAAINDTVKAVAHAIDGMGGPLKQSMQNIAAAIGDPYQAEAEYRQLLANGETLTSEAIRHWATIARDMRGASHFLDFVKEFIANLAQVIQNVNHFLPPLVEEIQRFGARVYNLADKFVPWLSGVLSWITPQILWLISQLPPFMDVLGWAVNTYKPDWGALNLTYAPPSNGHAAPMAQALCRALRERNAPGVEKTCAPGSPNGDGISLGDLLVGRAVG